MLLLLGATITFGISVEAPRKTGALQLVPPSVDFTRPMPVPSKGSPSPRYRTLLLFGSIARWPHESEPSDSVLGAQLVPPSVVFQTPPPESQR